MPHEPDYEAALNRNERTFRPAPIRLGPLTVVLIAICAVVAFLSKLGHKDDFVERLLITRGATKDRFRKSSTGNSGGC